MEDRLIQCVGLPSFERSAKKLLSDDAPRAIATLTRQEEDDLAAIARVLAREDE